MREVLPWVDGGGDMSNVSAMEDALKNLRADAARHYNSHRDTLDAIDNLEHMIMSEKRGFNV